MARPKSIDLQDQNILKQIEIFGSLCATHEEMASWFEVSVRTIERYMVDDGEKDITEFCRVYKKAQSEAKQSLRTLQVEKAKQGDSTMLVWLGKQLLDQKDKRENENVNRNISVLSDKPMSEEEFEDKYATGVGSAEGASTSTH